MLLEQERLPDGGLAQVLTVFFTGRECPFTCVFCDLWRFTIDQPTANYEAAGGWLERVDAQDSVDPGNRIALVFRLAFTKG